MERFILFKKMKIYICCSLLIFSKNGQNNLDLSYWSFFLAPLKLQKRTTPRILKISEKFVLHVIEKEIERCL